MSTDFKIEILSEANIKEICEGAEIEPFFVIPNKLERRLRDEWMVASSRGAVIWVRYRPREVYWIGVDMRMSMQEDFKRAIQVEEMWTVQLKEEVGDNIFGAKRIGEE